MDSLDEMEVFEVIRQQNDEPTPPRNARRVHRVKEKTDYFQKIEPYLARLRTVPQSTQIAVAAIIVLLLATKVYVSFSPHIFDGVENQLHEELKANMTQETEELKESITNDYERMREELEKILGEVQLATHILQAESARVVEENKLLRAEYETIISKRREYEEEDEHQTKRTTPLSKKSRMRESETMYGEQQSSLDDILDLFGVDNQDVDDEYDQTVDGYRKGHNRGSDAEMHAREREDARQLEIERFEEELRRAEEERQSMRENERRTKAARKPSADRKIRGYNTRQPRTLGYLILRTAFILITSLGTLIGICATVDKIVKKIPLSKSVMYAAFIPLFCFLSLLAATAFKGTVVSVNVAISLVVLIAVFISPRLFKEDGRSNAYLVFFIIASCAGSIFQLISTVLSIWNL